MKELIIRHITSPGFQRRVRNIYWPFLKDILGKPYNAAHNSLNAGYYEEQMKYSEEQDTYTDSEEIDSVSYSAEGEPLSQEVAFDLVKGYLVLHEKQNFGMCVTHTVKNIFRFAAMSIFDGFVDFSEHDVYLDRTTRQKGIDAGMNSSRTLDRVIEKGVAIHGIVPDPEREIDLKTTREDYPDEIVAPFRLKLLKSRGFIDGREDFDKVWGFIMENYTKRGVRPFQMSIQAMRGWWTSDVPTATGTIYGGHSAVGLTIPFMYKGKRAFFCIDSSFRSGLVWKVDTGVRIVTEDCWNGLGRYIRPVEFIDVIEKELGGSVEVPVGEKKLEHLTVTSQFGQENVHIEKMQKALIAMGFDLPAITKAGVPYGYYGTETAAAVKKFQKTFWELFNGLDDQWTEESLAALQGKSFGNLSLQVMNMLIDRQ